MGATEIAESILLKEAEHQAVSQKHQTAQQQDKIRLFVSKIDRYVAEVAIRVGKIKSILGSLSMLSQAEGTLTSTKTDGFAQNQAAENERNRNIDHDSEAHFLPKKLDVPAMKMKAVAFEDPSPFSLASLRKVEIPLRAKLVIAVFEKAMGTGKFLKRYKKMKTSSGEKKGGKTKSDEETSKDEDAESGSFTLPVYKEQIQNTVSKLRKVLDEVIDDHTKFVANKDSNESLQINIDELGIEPELAFPGPTCQEVEGVHPIWTLLLEYIGKCHAIDSTEKTAVSSHTDADGLPPPLRTRKTPNETQRIKPEMATEGTIERKKRYSDLVVWKIGRFVSIMRDDAIMFCIELKPGQRTYSDVLQMINEYKDQNLCHMSKSVAVGFNFAGVGVNTHATSVGGTLCFVTVYQLQLSEAGTPNADLSLKSTDVMPLFSPEIIDSWYGSDPPKSAANRESIAKVKKRLYPDNGASHDSSDDVQLGFKALWQLFGMSHASLFGPEWKKASPGLGTLLGSGTFGSVYKYQHLAYDDSVVKVSRFGRRKAIDNDVKVLSYLSKQHTDAHGHIQCYKKHGLLEIEIGGVTKKMPAVVTSPQGVPLLSCIKMKGIVQIVAEGMESALDCIHSLDVCHNDFGIKNIVMKYDGTSWRAVLIDFSVACSSKRELYGFVGTVPFVHRQIQIIASRTPWHPNPKFDRAALGFTMAFIAAGTGSCPWTGFSGKPVKDPDTLEDRVDAAIYAVKKADCEEKIKEKCTEWILLDNDTKKRGAAKRTRNENNDDWMKEKVSFTDLL